MTLTPIFKNFFSFALIAFALFTSCDSNSDSDASDDGEPVLVENYYFKGQIDGEELLLEKNIYASTLDNDPNEQSIDYGGSQTDADDVNNPDNELCFGRYAFGLLFYNWQDNPNGYDAAKMYLSSIPVGECTLANELNAMTNFFALNDYTYDIFPDYPLNNVAFDFFPVEFPNGEDYYSSRFGDNTDASFTITSVIEDDGFFILEGTFSCKLYGFVDDTDVKELENGEFKIKIRANLEE
jgi:hypothetical protein